jgi:hypothetical protein
VVLTDAYVRQRAALQLRKPSKRVETCSAGFETP